MVASDWATISALATAAGTLVLAIATFGAVRSSNRAAQVAELALQEQRRPVLVPSRLEDRPQRLDFADRTWLTAHGGYGAVALVDGRVYLALSLRNVASGIGVCQAWHVDTAPEAARARDHVPLDQFQLQHRDLYIPGNDVGMWQASLRQQDDPRRAALAKGACLN